MDHDLRTFVNLKHQAFGTCHVSLVTTTIEVFDITFQQVPGGADLHLSFVVSTEDTGEMIEIPLYDIPENGYTHSLKTFQVTQLVFCCAAGTGRNRCRHTSAIVDTNIRGLGHCRVVAATIDVGDGTASQFQVGLDQVGRTLTGKLLFCIVVVTVTAAEELSDENSIRFCGGRRSSITLTCRRGLGSFGCRQHISVICVFICDTVVRRMCQLCRHGRL